MEAEREERPGNKRKAQGENGMTEDIIIPVLGDDNIFSLFRAFLLELHEKEFIHVPNGTSGMAINENFRYFIDEQTPDNMVILKK